MFKYLNKHKELIPLFVCVGAGCFGATFYLARLALKNPDCSWDRKNNPHPWLHIKPQQNIKFVSVNDWSNRKDPRPEELRNL